MQTNIKMEPALNHIVEPLQLRHQMKLEGLLGDLGDGLSEYCFSNLYLFRQVHEYKFIDCSHPHIIGITYDRCSFLMPLFDVSTIEHEQLKRLCKGIEFIYPVSAQQLASLDKSKFKVDFKYSDSDYIYSADKIRNYRGNKLLKKKNLMNQFLKTNCPDYKVLNSDQFEDAQTVLDQWQIDKTMSPHETDYFPCLEALKTIETLKMVGLLYYVGVESAGFVIGKEVSPGIFAIHFAKGIDKFKGIFQYMFNHIANYLDNKVVFFNFEQDLGKPNFRQTKCSYDPDLLLHKYRIIPL